MSDTPRTVNMHINAVQQTQIIENLEACLRRQIDAHRAHLKATDSGAALAQINAEAALGAIKQLGRISPRNAYYSALGYLSTWNMTHPVVNIYPESQGTGNTDFIAVYKRADGTHAYTIAAIWHDDHYGFHS